MSAKPVAILIAVDTEEDNWTPAFESIGVENIHQIAKFQKFIQGLGLRPTYFTSYQVAKTEWAAAELLAASESGRAELAAHLHPWNTPPLYECPFSSNTMTKNLPKEVQEAKLRYLTENHRKVFGRQPVSFRAGRYGLGRQLIKPLIEHGYRVDSSVTPFWDWRAFDNGPDFRDAPMGRYRLNLESVTVVHDMENGALVELPLSCGFNRRPFSLWSRVDRVLRSPPLRTLRAPGIAWRTGLLRRIILSPEVHTADDMIVLARKLVEHGVDYLQVTLHSSSLMPGLSPFTRSWADVDAVYGRIVDLADHLTRFSAPYAAVVGDFAAVFPDSDTP